jgi:hypothetical protein
MVQVLRGTLLFLFKQTPTGFLFTAQQLYSSFERERMMINGFYSREDHKHNTCI